MIVKTFRELRALIPDEYVREDLLPLSLKHSLSFMEVLGSGLVLYLVVWLGLWGLFSLLTINNASDMASLCGLLLACAFWMLPFLTLIRVRIRKEGRGLRLYLPAWRFYSTTQQIIASAALVFIVGQTLKENYPLFQRWVQQSRNSFGGNQQSSALPQKQTQKPLNPKGFSSLSSLSSTQIYFLGWPLCSLSLYGLMFWFSRPKAYKRKNKSKTNSLDLASFGLWLGESTGHLVDRWHSANLAPGQHIGLTLQDATQNIIVLGAIGSGKTTRAMHPLLLQLLDQDCGGLIFDIKGDFKKAVLFFSSITKKHPIFVGVNQKPLNLLEGLSPEVAASFLKSALLLAGGSKSDSFWIDTGVELCRNALGVLSFIPEHYTLRGLYCYLFDKAFGQEIDQQIKEGRGSLEDGRLLESYQHYLDSIFSTFDEKIRSGVLANVAQILSPFQHPELVDTFCTSQKQKSSMKDLLNGAIYVIDMPLSKWGLAGKVIYTLIKLRFFNMMQQRVLHEDQNQSRPIFFMCDEYQEIVSCNKDGLSDLNFWDKSRSSRTIGIISAQSVSSFYASIGDRDLVHALLQNFRQKLVFRVEDDWTIQYCNRLLGQVETQKITHSISSSKDSWTQNQNKSSSQSIHYQQKDVIDGGLFRTLKTNQGLALLSLNGHAADDVLTVKALFAPEESFSSKNPRN